MENGVLFQAFEWYCPDNGSYYRNLMEKVVDLAANGVSAIWLPPVYKGTGPSDVGYGVYDLYDLGEFNQKGTVRTKYGTKQELLSLIQRCHELKMQVYADVVLNHKGGADATERFMAVKVDPHNRTLEMAAPREIEGWTRFDFAGRNKAYSDFTWSHVHFSGVDYDKSTDESAIFRIIGENKGWNLGVSTELGNYDYLMFADIDHAHPDVKAELFRWADWFIRETGVDGFRLDAVKHIDHVFMKDFQAHIRAEHGENFYLLGEYWLTDKNLKEEYLIGTEYGIDLFTVGLHFQLHEASVRGREYDLRTIFDNTLVKEFPSLSVTFVDNHDTQPGQALQSWVEPWFKESAYALILLRCDGYPCVFHGDYYGTGGEHPFPGMKDRIDILLAIRRQFAYGEQHDYFDHPNLIGWVRHGDAEHPFKTAVVITNADEGVLTMSVGEPEAGKTYRDRLGNNAGRVLIRDDGTGDFPAAAGKVCVWLADKAVRKRRRKRA